jgi:hypothetical protein
LVLTVTPKPTKVSTPVTICSGENVYLAANATAILLVEHTLN